MIKTNFKILILLSFFLQNINAQYSSISGRVVDSISNKPIEFVTVFIVNTSKYTYTDINGNFKIDRIPEGTQQLVATIVGYDKFIRTFTIKNNSKIVQNIKLINRPIVLKEVIVKPDKKLWEQNFNFFKDLFIGDTTEQLNCRIKNPEVLNFIYDKVNNSFIASSSDKIIIENTFTGYTIHYYLQNFQYNTKSRFLFVDGIPYFSKIKEKSRYEKARKEIYRGSLMHFLRSAYDSTLYKNFVVWQLISQKNYFVLDSITKSYYSQYRENKILLLDSLLYYSNLMSKYINNETLIALHKLEHKDLIVNIDSTRKALVINSHIAIDFNKLERTVIFGNGNNLITQMIFEKNGNNINYKDVTLKGGFGLDKIARLLPLDYIEK